MIEVSINNVVQSVQILYTQKEIRVPSLGGSTRRAPKQRRARAWLTWRLSSLCSGFEAPPRSAVVTISAGQRKTVALPTLFCSRFHSAASANDLYHRVELYSDGVDIELTFQSVSRGQVERATC